MEAFDWDNFSFGDMACNPAFDIENAYQLHKLPEISNNYECIYEDSYGDVLFKLFRNNYESCFDVVRIIPARSINGNPDFKTDCLGQFECNYDALVALKQYMEDYDYGCR